MKLLLLTSGLILTAVSAAFVPPGPEEEDGYYRDSPELSARWYADPGVDLRTPGAAEGRWSTVDEVYHALEELAAARTHLTVKDIGKSLEGMPIKALFYEVDRNGALTVLVQARVHGNEPASTEGALELAYELAYGELSNLDINLILIPVLNPEGARDMQRRTGTDVDPNRDYILHNSGSIRAVYRLMNEYDPEVVLDMHEHDAYAWPYDLMTIGPNNPNLPNAIREMTSSVIIEGIRNAFDKAGLRIGPYRLLDRNENGFRVRESATTFVSGKNALAMGGRISLLTEGRGIGLGNQHFNRRTYTQYTAAKAVVEAAAQNEQVIREVVSETRKHIASRPDGWILQVDPVKRAAKHRLMDAESLELVEVETTYWDRSNGRVTAIGDVPDGFVIPVTENKLIDHLRRFGIKLEPINEARTLLVGKMTIESFNAGTDILYGGQLKLPDGSLVRPAVLRNHDIRITTQYAEREFPAGSMIAWTNQPNALYLITLEPMCYSGFASLGFWGDDLPAGFEFPLYRLPRKDASVDNEVGNQHGDDPAQHGH